MNCETCKDRKAEHVPYIVHESAMARHERTIKRFIIVLIVIAIAWFATIGLFVWYLDQYDFIGTEYVQDGQGVNIIGDRNGVDFNVPESVGSAAS